MTGVDIEGLQGFLDESDDSLQGIESDFIELENDRNNLEIINRIFRPIHSLKGNSGFFGLTNINKFAHRLENLLDLVRKGEILVNKEIVDLLLQGVEYLEQMLERAGQDPADTALRPDEKEFIKLVEQHKPEEVAGSIQSVIELESSLQEAIAAGINLHENSLIDNLLIHIEKSNKEIKKIIAAAYQPNIDIFEPGAAYSYQGEDCTEHLLVFAEIFDLLQKKSPVEHAIIKDAGEKLKIFGELFAENDKWFQTVESFMK